MTEEYVQLVPSTDGYDTEAVVEVLAGLRRFEKPPEDHGLLARLFGGAEPATFEFLAVCAGGDAPVEFFYGADGMGAETLRTELRNCYPRSFELSTTEFDPLQRLAPHVAYEPAAFLRAVRTDALWADPDVETPGEIVTDEAAAEAVEDALDPAPTTHERSTLATTDGPVYTTEDTVLARPSVDELRPVGLRWHGVGEHRRDWMCPLTPPVDLAEEAPPLATLIDQLGAATVPLAFQVVFRRRRPWSGARAERVSDIKRGTDTRLGQVATFVQEIVQEEYSEERDREELSRRARRRLSAVESVDPDGTVDVTVRALTLTVDTEAGDPLVDATGPRDPVESRPRGLQRLRSALGSLGGDFYRLEPTPFRDEGLLHRSRERNARRALTRFLDRELYTDESGRARPHLVATPDALAGLVAVPAGEDLSVPATRATRTADESQTPLPRPDPDQLRPFRRGMAVGHALDGAGQPEDEPLRVPTEALTKHYARYGPTGTGKSKAVQNDVLSLSATTDGPTVLVDRKGDGMAENYLRAHYARFGDLEDVYHLSVPDVVPAIPFFDVRPGLAAGRDRATVVQETVEHFRELLRLVMGEELFERAFVANEILTFLIKALFDPMYGGDAYGLEELTTAALRMQRERKMPPVSKELEDVRQSLDRQFQKDKQQFQRSMDAVVNRLDQLRQNTHLTTVLRSTPDWDPDREGYGPGTFDFRRLLDEDCVVLLDLGDLRDESSRALTLLLLSNLWDALQYRRQARRGVADDELVTCIVDEAAPLVASRLVHEDLLPQGRSFGLGLGLVMQFPEQVQNVAAERGTGRRAYHELMNNVHTQLIGGITLTDEFGSSLVAEGLDIDTLRQRCNQLPAGEWIVDLPQTPFLEPPPQPLSVQSLPIPEGHPESDRPLTGETERAFERARERVRERSRRQFGVDRHGGRRDAPAESEDTVVNTRMPRQAGGETVPGSTPSEVTDAVSDAPPVDADPTRGTAQTDTVDAPPEGLLPSDDDTDDAASGEEDTTTGSVTDGDTDDSGETPDSGAAGPEDTRRPGERDTGGVGSGDPAEKVIERVLAATSGDVEGYSLREGMADFVDVEGPDVDALVGDGLLERHRLGDREYYTVTARGCRRVDDAPATGDGVDDLVERTPHRVGVTLLADWLDAQPGVDRVRTRHEHGGVVYDVAAYAGGSLAWVGEVETGDHDSVSVAEDYRKLAEVDASAVWTVPDHETARVVLTALSNADLVPEVPTGDQAATMVRLQKTVADWATPGLDTLLSYRQCRTETAEDH